MEHVFRFFIEVLILALHSFSIFEAGITLYLGKKVLSLEFLLYLFEDLIEKEEEYASSFSIDYWILMIWKES